MSELAGASDATLIIVAAISAVPAIVVALINRKAHKETKAKLNDNTAKTEKVLHQVKNDHDINLRDDLDEFKKDMADTLEKIEAAQGYLGSTLGNVLRDVRTNIRHQRAHDVASAMVVEELRKRDAELAMTIEQHHPQEGTDRDH